MVQHPKRIWFYRLNEEGNDVFVHITAVQNSGLTGLNEGQQVTRARRAAQRQNGRSESRDCE